MPEIVGHFPLEEDPLRMVPCVLCLEPTSTRAVAPGLGADVELPLHIMCAGWLVVAYGRLRAGRISAGMAGRLAAYATRAKELGAGRE